MRKETIYKLTLFTIGGIWGFIITAILYSIGKTNPETTMTMEMALNFSFTLIGTVALTLFTEHLLKKTIMILKQ